MLPFALSAISSGCAGFMPAFNLHGGWLTFTFFVKVGTSNSAIIAFLHQSLWSAANHVVLCDFLELPGRSRTRSPPIKNADFLGRLGAVALFAEH